MPEISLRRKVLLIAATGAGITMISRVCRNAADANNELLSI
jgi:hypothetical protein